MTYKFYSNIIMKNVSVCFLIFIALFFASCGFDTEFHKQIVKRRQQLEVEHDKMEIYHDSLEERHLTILTETLKALTGKVSKDSLYILEKRQEKVISLHEKLEKMHLLLIKKQQSLESLHLDGQMTKDEVEQNHKLMDAEFEQLKKEQAEMEELHAKMIEDHKKVLELEKNLSF